MSAIVKYLFGKLAKKPQAIVLNPQPIHSQSTQIQQPEQSNHLTGGMAPSLSTLVKVFDTAPEAKGIFENHFGIDLQALAGMSPQELGKMTDMILQAKEFMQHLPTIEQHINDYIKAVTDYNTFIARSVKAGFTGIKEIDKSRLDVFLEMAGYKAHTEKLGRKSDNAVKQIEADKDNFISLSDFTLQTALQIKATALAKAKEQVEQRPVVAAEQAEQREIVNRRKQEIKNLITYGTRGKQ
jgi:hypothetical protein